MALVWIIIGIIALIALGSDNRTTGIIEGIGVVGIIAAFFTVLYFIAQVSEYLLGFVFIVFLVYLLARGFMDDSGGKDSDAQRDFIKDCEEQKLQSLSKELADAGFIFDKFWMHSFGADRGFFLQYRGIY